MFNVHDVCVGVGLFESLEAKLCTHVVLVVCVGFVVGVVIGVKTVHVFCVGSMCRFLGLFEKLESNPCTRFVAVPCVGFVVLVDVGVKTVDSLCIGSVCRCGGSSRGWSQNNALVFCSFHVWVLWLL